MIVMITAITPSLNSSNRPLSIFQIVRCRSVRIPFSLRSPKGEGLNRDVPLGLRLAVVLDLGELGVDDIVALGRAAGVRLRILGVTCRWRRRGGRVQRLRDFL